MDTATLYIVHYVLSEGSIRGVARMLGRPPASVEAALVRFEEELSMPLAARAGMGLNLTLEARRIVPLTKTAAEEVARLYALAGDTSINRPARTGIGLEALARLIAVAEAGSVRKAARVLGVGQPQLTRQMSGLERDLGGHILIRTADGTRLTELGEAVIEIAARLQELWAELSARSGERFRRTMATVRLGSVMPLGHESQIARMLAGLLTRWQEEHPRQPLFISSTTADDLLAGIKSGRFDATLLDTAEIPDDCEGVLIGRTPLSLVAAEALLADPASIVQLLTRAPIAVPSQRSGLRQQFDALLYDSFSEAARRDLIVVEIDSIPVILNLVLDHGFVSVLPETSVANIGAKLGQLRLDDRQLGLWLVWPKTPAGRQAGRSIAAMLPVG